MVTVKSKTVRQSDLDALMEKLLGDPLKYPFVSSPIPWEITSEVLPLLDRRWKVYYTEVDPTSGEESCFTAEFASLLPLPGPPLTPM